MSKEEKPKKEEQEEKSPPLQQRLVVIQVGKSRIDLLRDDTASTFELVGILQALISQLMRPVQPQ